MAWSIVIGVVNWWSGCKFLSHGCHYLSSPSFIVPSVYPSLSLLSAAPRIHVSLDLSLLLSIGKANALEIFTVEIHLIDRLKFISWNYSHLCSGNCLCWLPTNGKLWACQSWRLLRGCRGAAAAAAAGGADVPPNYRSHHAETILLNHFKASAIGVTARLNQLQNASPVSIPRCWIDSVVLCALGKNVHNTGFHYKWSFLCQYRNQWFRLKYIAWNLVIVFHFQIILWCSERSPLVYMVN